MLELLNGREHFFQWDTNQKVKIDDNEVLVVQYDNGTGDALVCPVYEYEGQRVADVPNIMLQMPIVIKAYAACEDCVRYARAYKVEQRSRPDDYIYTETETLKYSALLAMIEDTKADIATYNAEAAATDELLLEKLEQEAATRNTNDKLLESTIYNNKIIADGQYQALQNNLSNVSETAEAKDKALETKIEANTADIERQKTRIDYINNTLLPNHYGHIENHERRITNLEQNGGGGTGSGSGCECKKIIGIKKAELTFDMPLEEMYALGVEGLKEYEIIIYVFDDIYKLNTMYQTDSSLTMYFINTKVNDIQEISVYISEYNGEMSLSVSESQTYINNIPTPLSSSDEGKTLVVRDGEYKLEENAASEEPLMLQVIDMGGELVLGEGMEGITPTIIAEWGNAMLSFKIAVIDGETMAISIYGIAVVSETDEGVIFDLSNGIKAIHWAADGTLSYLGG